MTLYSTVSIVPAEKKTDEHTVPLSETGEPPATHYGYHGWEPDRTQKEDEAVLVKRIDVYRKEYIEKEPLREDEKTSSDNFMQAVAALGLRTFESLAPDAKIEAKEEVKGK